MLGYSDLMHLQVLSENNSRGVIDIVENSIIIGGEFRE
jgi:hypothetical protein